MNVKQLKPKALKPKNKQKKAIQERKRLKEWMKFLKSDVDWDYSAVLNVFAYKLERVRNCIAKNNYSENTDVVVKELLDVEAYFKEAQQLLKKVEADEDYSAPRDELEKKYGKTIRYNEKKHPNGNLSYSLKREKETPENEKEICTATKKAFAAMDENRKSDLQKGFDKIQKGFRLMSKNIWNWWD